MQIVIEISDYDKEWVTNGVYIPDEINRKIAEAIINGIPLDKIKTEILDEAEYAYADFDRYKEDILHAESDELPDDDFRYGLERAVEIINKYKTESEVQE